MNFYTNTPLITFKIFNRKFNKRFALMNKALKEKLINSYVKLYKLK